mmetsp:Transcript_46917/g.123115  ORF Transcript_46917/g.123115 Transcript_46917/m.123115 type:complete len:346 (+) Transcript_46917:432-1469(+)
MAVIHKWKQMPNARTIGSAALRPSIAGMSALRPPLKARKQRCKRRTRPRGSLRHAPTRPCHPTPLLIPPGARRPIWSVAAFSPPTASLRDLRLGSLNHFLCAATGVLLDKWTACHCFHLGRNFLRRRSLCPRRWDFTAERQLHRRVVGREGPPHMASRRVHDAAGRRRGCHGCIFRPGLDMQVGEGVGLDRHCLGDLSAVHDARGARFDPRDVAPILLLHGHVKLHEVPLDGQVVRICERVILNRVADASHALEDEQDLARVEVGVLVAMELVVHPTRLRRHRDAPLHVVILEMVECELVGKPIDGVHVQSSQHVPVGVRCDHEVVRWAVGIHWRRRPVLACEAR